MTSLFPLIEQGTIDAIVSAVSRGKSIYLIIIQYLGPLPAVKTQNLRPAILINK
jgi:hypothetical protein